ncbi:hypothetical protein KQH49_03140 [Mycetohabitans sp. B5]|nr:hypothetical protein [Mycetohabitans sp. B5]MCG1054011.1 hypothetical protein [Mycetohabitans sp. B5]
MEFAVDRHDCKVVASTITHPTRSQQAISRTLVRQFNQRVDESLLAQPNIRVIGNDGSKNPAFLAGESIH